MRIAVYRIDTYGVEHRDVYDDSTCYQDEDGMCVCREGEIRRDWFGNWYVRNWHAYYPVGCFTRVIEE